MKLPKNFSVFLLIAFGVAWMLFVLPLAFGSAGDANRQVITLIAWSAAMWAPGLAAIITTLKIDREPLNTLHLANLGERRAYIWAWLLPPVLVVITLGLTLLFGLGDLDREFTTLRRMLGQSGNTEISPWLVVFSQILSGLTVGPLLNTLAALGEELGWRAYLLPKLLHLGQWRAIIISGAIWGFWHAPVILQGQNYPDHRLLGVFLMIGFCILFGTILSWLYLRTRSPWAPALGHASLNAFAGLPVLFVIDFDTALGGYLPSLTGWVTMLLFIAWLVWSKRLPVPLSETGETGETGELITPPA